MTPKEFKEWFEGFTEAVNGHPTPGQWAKIKERVSQIDGTTTTYPVYVDRYWPRTPPPWWGTHQVIPMLDSGGSGGIAAGGGGYRVEGKADPNDVTFDADHSMRLLGKADYSDVVE